MARVIADSLLESAHRLVAAHLFDGATAIDGTVGNGHDTRFLAQAVGAKGRVLGFDVQVEALEKTRQLLHVHALSVDVRLFHEGHERLAARLAAEGITQIDAAMFNLGYLPGSDKRCTTRPDTTLVALQAALAHLAEGGVLTAMLYHGHSGADDEAEAVLAWARALPRRPWQATMIQPLQSPQAPTLLVVTR